MQSSIDIESIIKKYSSTSGYDNNDNSNTHSTSNSNGLYKEKSYNNNSNNNDNNSMINLRYQQVMIRHGYPYTSDNNNINTHSQYPTSYTGYVNNQDKQQYPMQCKDNNQDKQQYPMQYKDNNSRNKVNIQQKDTDTIINSNKNIKTYQSKPYEYKFYSYANPNYQQQYQPQYKYQYGQQNNRLKYCDDDKILDYENSKVKQYINDEFKQYNGDDICKNFRKYQTTNEQNKSQSINYQQIHINQPLKSINDDNKNIFKFNNRGLDLPIPLYNFTQSHNQQQHKPQFNYNLNLEPKQHKLQLKQHKLQLKQHKLQLKQQQQQLKQQQYETSHSLFKQYENNPSKHQSNLMTLFNQSPHHVNYSNQINTSKPYIISSKQLKPQINNVNLLSYFNYNKNTKNINHIDQQIQSAKNQIQNTQKPTSNWYRASQYSVLNNNNNNLSQKNNHNPSYPSPYQKEVTSFKNIQSQDIPFKNIQQEMFFNNIQKPTPNNQPNTHHYKKVQSTTTNYTPNNQGFIPLHKTKQQIENDLYDLNQYELKDKKVYDNLKINNNIKTQKLTQFQSPTLCGWKNHIIYDINTKDDNKNKSLLRKWC